MFLWYNYPCYVNDISRSKLVRYFSGTSIPAILMISHEISWWDCGRSDTNDTSDTSNTRKTANSSDASRTSASVTRLSSYFGQLPIAGYLCLNCFTFPRIITHPNPLSSVRQITTRVCPLKSLKCLAVCLYRGGSSVQNMSSSILVCPINIFLWLTKILQRPENK